MIGLWFDFSWIVTKHIQSMQMFNSKAVKSSKLVCCPMIDESIVLGLDCFTCWPSCSSLSDIVSLVSMLKYFP